MQGLRVQTGPRGQREATAPPEPRASTEVRALLAPQAPQALARQEQLARPGFRGLSGLRGQPAQPEPPQLLLGRRGLLGLLALLVLIQPLLVLPDQMGLPAQRVLYLPLLVRLVRLAQLVQRLPLLAPQGLRESPAPPVQFIQLAAGLTRYFIKMGRLSPPTSP